MKQEKRTAYLLIRVYKSKIQRKFLTETKKRLEGEKKSNIDKGSLQKKGVDEEAEKT